MLFVKSKLFQSFIFQLFQVYCSYVSWSIKVCIWINFKRYHFISFDLTSYKNMSCGFVLFFLQLIVFFFFKFYYWYQLRLVRQGTFLFMLKLMYMCTISIWCSINVLEQFSNPLKILTSIYKKSSNTCTGISKFDLSPNKVDMIRFDCKYINISYTLYTDLIFLFTVHINRRERFLFCMFHCL